MQVLSGPPHVLPILGVLLGALATDFIGRLLRLLCGTTSVGYALSQFCSEADEFLGFGLLRNFVLLCRLCKGQEVPLRLRLL